MRCLNVLVIGAAVLFTPLAHAQSVLPGEVFSSISLAPVSAPNPVLGADGRVQLAYELLAVNYSDLFVTLDKVEAIDDGGRALWSIEGDQLSAMVKQHGGSGRLLAPGGSAIVFMAATTPGGAPLPHAIKARVTATRQSVGPDGKPAPLSPSIPVPATFTFEGAGVAVGKPAVVLAPPLKGKGWIAANGCCDSITSHRGAIMALNGQLRVPERFAIDWLQLDATGRVFMGDGQKLSSYAYYGVPIHAAADGVVVNLYDGADEQVPGSAKGITTDNIGGNMVVVDIGGGAFAFYAHMQRGSLKVKLGDHVKTGDVLGLLGNTGNSTAPHLHFHVMDSPSPLDANGLPYVFTSFESRGSLAPGAEDAAEKGETVKILPTLTGPRKNAMPMNDEVVDFN